MLRNCSKHADCETLVMCMVSRRIGEIPQAAAMQCRRYAGGWNRSMIGIISWVRPGPEERRPNLPKTLSEVS